MTYMVTNYSTYFTKTVM